MAAPPATARAHLLCAVLTVSAVACGGVPHLSLPYDDGKKRETPELSSFQVKLTGADLSEDTIEVLGLAEPKVVREKDGSTKIDIRYAKEEPDLQCLVTKRFIAAGAQLRSVATTLLATSQQKGYAIRVGGTPKTPTVSMNMLLEMPEDGRAVLVEWKAALAYSGKSTVLCQTATVGYDATIQRIFDKLVLGSFAREADAPSYADLSVAKKGNFVVGFEWTRAYAEAAEIRTVVYTTIFGMSTDGFVGTDHTVSETSTDKGELLVHVHTTDSRTESQTLTLRADGKTQGPQGGTPTANGRGAAFELAIGEDTMSGKLSGLPSSYLQSATTLKRIAKGMPRPGVLRKTDVNAGTVTIKDIPVTRETSTSVLLAESDGHARCELDEDGRCARYAKGSITLDRLSRFGQFPRVP